MKQSCLEIKMKHAFNITSAGNRTRDHKLNYWLLALTYLGTKALVNVISYCHIVATFKVYHHKIMTTAYCVVNSMVFVKNCGKLSDVWIHRQLFPPADWGNTSVSVHQNAIDLRCPHSTVPHCHTASSY